MQASEQVVELRPITDRMKFDQGDLLCKVEIDCRTAYFPGPCGYLIGFGKQILTVRKNDLPMLLEQVENEPQEIVAAQRRYEIGLEKYLNENCEGIEAANREARREQLKAEYALSMEAIFERDVGRSIKPFVSVKVVQEDLPIPADQASVSQQNAVAASVAAEVAKAIAGLMQQQQLQPNQQKKS